MEKFSAFRDPGTGIQPFLKPVPPSGSDVLATILLPVGLLVGTLKTVLLLGLALVYAVVVNGACLIFYPIRPLYRAITHVLTVILARTALLLVGLYWIPVDVVARKRGRGAPRNEAWSPRAGDIIVSNWASWIEILWLAFRFNPVFVLPVCSTLDISAPASAPSTPLSRTPGRRTGTGSAAISAPAARAPTARVPLAGFRRVGLLGMLAAAGHLPLLARAASSPAEALEDVRRAADRPVVVFPEGTTSNGRALLRFADVFAGVKVPVTTHRVFVMCVRYDQPTAFAPSLSHSIPGSVLNPLRHAFTLASSLAPLTLSIRLLSPSESPSSGSFLLSEFLTGGGYTDELGECCAALMAQIGRVKRVGMGWEDKAAFLNLYKGKK